MAPAATSIPHPLPGPYVDLIAQRFRVMGEPMRYQDGRHLREGPRRCAS